MIVHSRSNGVSRSNHGGLQASVPIRGYFFVDYGDTSLGTYREGQYARKNGKREKKAEKLKHRE
jgi:hypothetical protein